MGHPTQTFYKGNCQSQCEEKGATEGVVGVGTNAMYCDDAANQLRTRAS